MKATATANHERAELDSIRQLPPQAVADVLGLAHDPSAQRQHGGAGYSYWRTPDGMLITVRQGRVGWVWHPTQRDGGAGGDWLALYQHLNPGASLSLVQRGMSLETEPRFHRGVSLKEGGRGG